MNPPWSLLTLLLLTMLCGTAAAADPAGIVATVGHGRITESRLQRALHEHLHEHGIRIDTIRETAALERIRTQVLEGLIGQELIWQAALLEDAVATEAEVEHEFDYLRQTFETDLDFHARIRDSGHTRASYRQDLRQRITAQKWIRAHTRIDIDEADIIRYYHLNREQFAIPEQLHLRLILVRLPNGAGARDRRLARDSLDDLRRQAASGTDFAELARLYSDDSSAERGGDIGYRCRGEMIAPLEQAAFALSPGEISTVVETGAGLNLVQLVDREPPSYYPLSSVAEPIRALLLEQGLQASLETTVLRLRQKTTVAINRL